MTRRRAPGAVAGLAIVAALLTGCTDDSSDPESDEPSSAQVLQRLGEHPDALRAAAGPSAPGMPEPSVDFDDHELDELVEAGGDDDAAEEFRSTYLAYVEDGVEQTVRDAADGDWYDALEVVDQVWIDPSAEVLGALEAGCDQSGGTCDDRLDQAELELRDAVEAAAYAVIPAKLLPKAFVQDGERVAMSDWTKLQQDDWQRLRDTTLLPQTAGSVERATFARRQSTGA